MTDKMFSIQSKLLTLEGDSVFATSIRMAANDDLPGCLKMILEQAKDNRELVEKIIGTDLLMKIDPEYYKLILC